MVMVTFSVRTNVTSEWVSPRMVRQAEQWPHPRWLTSSWSQFSAAANAFAAFERFGRPLPQALQDVQKANYKALRDYKSGKRKNPIMAGIIAGVDEKEFPALAEFFANQTAPPAIKTCVSHMRKV